MLHGFKQLARNWPVVGPVLADRDRLRAAHHRLQAAHDELLAQRDRLLAAHDDLKGQRDRLLAAHDDLKGQRDRLLAGHDELRDQRDRLLAAHGQLQAELAGLNKADWVPSGHYYSPIPSQQEVRANEALIWGEVPRSLPALDLNEPGQVAVFDELKKYYADLPFADKPKPNLRYYFDNDWFTYGDGTILYSMIRHLKPKRIIEIGSGYSSAVMLDTNDLFFGGQIACTFIEPNPERLLTLLRDSDQSRNRVITQKVQEVGLDCFGELSAGDILFVDSSHVSKVNSDVNWILFKILPALRQGVTVHFHDVFAGFEYPKEWILEGRAWNEDYLLRAFLQYNHAFRVQFFNAFFGRFYRDRLERDMPLCAKRPGGSIWLMKTTGEPASEA